MSTPDPSLSSPIVESPVESPVESLGESFDGPISVSLSDARWLELKQRLKSKNVNDSGSKIDSSFQKLSITGCDGRPFVAPRWDLPNAIEFDHDLGDYFMSYLRGAEVEVRGSIGHNAGQAIESGSIIIRGHVGDCLAAFGSGGMIAVYGNAGRRVAVGLSGADVLVRGSVGAQAAYGMRSGSLIVGGNAGPELGKSMTGGVIYIRGETPCVAEHLDEVRMREADRMRISLILLKAGIKSTGREFRVFRVSD